MHGGMCPVFPTPVAISLISTDNECGRVEVTQYCHWLLGNCEGEIPLECVDPFKVRELITPSSALFFKHCCIMSLFISWLKPGGVGHGLRARDINCILNIAARVHQC